MGEGHHYLLTSGIGEGEVMYYKNPGEPNEGSNDRVNDATIPELMTRSDLARFLRLDEVSKARSIDNVIDNLQRMRNLPVVHICRQPLYWLPAVRDWLKQQVEEGL